MIIETRRWGSALKAWLKWEALIGLPRVSLLVKENGVDVFRVAVAELVERAELSLCTAGTTPSKTSGMLTSVIPRPDTHLPLNFHLVIYSVYPTH